MKRQRLEHSVIVSAKGPTSDTPLTLLAYELGEESLSFKSFAPLPKGTQWKLQLSFWNRSVVHQAEVLEMEPYNGAWQGVMLFLAG
jgi:hypothetical protein